MVDGAPSPADEKLDDRDARRAEAALASGAVPFHGAALAAPGGVVVLAGVSGSGKSTLAAAATLAGWGYIADEVASVDPQTAHATPYHRPIGLRRQGADALGVPFPANRKVPGDPVDWPVDPDHHSPGGTVAVIALVTWVPTAPTTCDAVEPVQAMVELMQHLVADADAAPWCFRAVEAIVRSVPVVRLSYRDPPAGLDALAGRLASQSATDTD